MFGTIFNASDVRGHSTTTWTRRGGGGSAKSPRLSTQGGGPLNVHVDQNLAISESISYYCALGGKKVIKFHQIELN